MDGVMGGMNERAKTTEGKLSNLTDALQAVYVKLFNAIMPAQQALIESATGIIAPLAQQEDLYKAIGDRAKELSDYLKANPQIIEEIRRQLQEGMLLVFNSVSATAKQILDYLKANPTAIEDAVKSMGTLLNITKELLNVLGFVLKGYQAIGDTIRVIGQELNRINDSKKINTLDIYNELIAAGATPEQASKARNRAEDEIDKLGIGARLNPYTEEVQTVLRQILEKELKLLNPDYGPLTRGASLKPLPVPVPPRSRSGASLPPPPSTGASTPRQSSGQTPPPPSPSSTTSGYAKGFERLSDLENFLNSNPLFANNPTARAVALAIAAGEVGSPWLKETSNINLFRGRGGTGNAMQGFAQFNTRYFKNIDNPVNYLDLLAKMLTGQSTLPTGQGRLNIKELENLIAGGQISTPQQFLAYLQKAMPIANWEGLFGPGGQRVLQSRVLDVQLNRLTNNIPNNQIRNFEEGKNRAQSVDQLAREVAKLTQLIGGNVSKIALPQNLFGEITPPTEFMGMRFGSSTVGAGIPPVNLDLFLATLTKNQEAIEAATEALKLGIERFTTATLPSFGEITPPTEFEGFSFGSSTVGVDAPVTYPDRIIEMAENARLAMERLDDMVAVFAETGTVGVEKLATGFEKTC